MVTVLFRAADFGKHQKPCNHFIHTWAGCFSRTRNVLQQSSPTESIDRYHPHRFKVNGRVLSTWCAWDALFLPVLLRRTAEIESTCATTKAKIRVRITPEAVEQIDPPESVITFAVPKVGGRRLKSAETIRETFCCLVHFFASQESALEWMSATVLDLSILSVEDGYQLGRMAFGDVLEDGKHPDSL